MGESCGIMQQVGSGKMKRIGFSPARLTKHTNAKNRAENGLGAAQIERCVSLSRAGSRGLHDALSCL